MMKTHFIDVIDKIADYTSVISKRNIAIYLTEYTSTHGETAVQALYDFINYAEKNNVKKEIIMATIVHDLGGRNDKLMSPRSISYLGK